MSVTAERRILNFADDGVSFARDGILPKALDELIARLADEGLLNELLAHEWVEGPEAFQRRRFPVPRRKGCLFALPGVIRFWLSPWQVAENPPPVSDHFPRPLQ